MATRLGVSFQPVAGPNFVRTCYARVAVLISGRRDSARVWDRLSGQLRILVGLAAFWRRSDEGRAGREAGAMGFALDAGRIYGSIRDRRADVFSRGHAICSEFIFLVQDVHDSGRRNQCAGVPCYGVSASRNVEQRSSRTSRGANLRHVFDNPVAGHYRPGALVLVPPHVDDDLERSLVAPASRLSRWKRGRRFSRSLAERHKIAGGTPEAPSPHETDIIFRVTKN